VKQPDAAGTRGSARGLAFPAVMAMVMFAILIGLGVWQLYRLNWKRGILAEIDRGEASPPIPLPEHPGRFQKVAVTGVLRPGPTAQYGVDVRDTPRGPLMGSELIQPLIRAAGPPILVDRGWVPQPPTAPLATPTGPITLQGYVRTPEHPGLFSPKDDPAARRFYTLNPQAIGAALGLAQVLPITLIVLGHADGYPAPATALPRPPNDHLGYAMTWFGLAITLVVVFAVWARRTLLEKADHGRL
jgi:surfeit locus 1 family protein